MPVISSVETNAFQPSPPGAVVCNAQSPAVDVELCTGDLWRMSGDNRWRLITCLQGEIWITQKYDVHDYILTVGQTLIVTQRGLVLVQALQDSSLQITTSLQTTPYTGNYTAFP